VRAFGDGGQLVADKHLIDQSEVNEEQTGSSLAPMEMLKEKIGQVLETLTYREREIIKLRYDLGEVGYPYTQEEVGRIFKVALDRVRTIESKALRKLQHPIRSGELEGSLDILATEDRLTPAGRLLEKVFGVSGRVPPSFFDFAKSERCQDAFISWLIAWAHDVYRGANEPLHRTGAYFLNRLLKLHGFDPPAKYTDLSIRPQYKRIDILVVEFPMKGGHEVKGYPACSYSAGER
jgi:hypothetical protein